MNIVDENTLAHILTYAINYSSINHVLHDLNKLKINKRWCHIINFNHHLWRTICDMFGLKNINYYHYIKFVTIPDFWNCTDMFVWGNQCFYIGLHTTSIYDENGKHLNSFDYRFKYHGDYLYDGNFIYKNNMNNIVYERCNLSNIIDNCGDLLLCYDDYIERVKDGKIMTITDKTVFGNKWYYNTDNKTLQKYFSNETKKLNYNGFIHHYYSTFVNDFLVVQNVGRVSIIDIEANMLVHEFINVKDVHILRIGIIFRDIFNKLYTCDINGKYVKLIDSNDKMFASMSTNEGITIFRQ